MEWVAFLGVPVLLGIAAQSGRNRTGAAWGLIALVVQAIALYVVFAALTTYSTGYHYSGVEAVKYGMIMAAAFALVVVGLVIVTLPARPAAAAPAADGAKADERACPHCAETIKAAARVCRFCGRDVADAADVVV